MGKVVDFPSFAKVARLNRNMVITEKIDGTNGLVFVDEDGAVRAGSRNRWLTPDDDNAGFAAWVTLHADELTNLGPGHHYGEWYGQGIQRKYGLTEKRFALFNVDRWTDDKVRPTCCHVVPVVSRFAHSDRISTAVHSATEYLRECGSLAVPGFMTPEGIVLWHGAGRQLYKVLLENDEVPKGMAA